MAGVGGDGSIALVPAGAPALTDAAGNPVVLSAYDEDTGSAGITPVTNLVSASATGVAGTGVDGPPSASGRVAAFNSVDGDLVSSGATDGTNNVFVKDTQTGAIILVSVGTDGQPVNGDSFGASISPTTPSSRSPARRPTSSPAEPRRARPTSMSPRSPRAPVARR